MRRLLVLPPLLVVLLCGFLAVSEDPGAGIEVHAIRMGEDAQGQTRIVLDLAERPQVVSGPLDTGGPEILIVPTGRHFVYDDGAGNKSGLGAIDSVIYGPAKVRIRLARTALPTRTFILPPAGKIRHHRLVIDLDTAGADAFADAAAAFAKELAAVSAEPVDEPLPLAAAGRSVPPPSLKPQRLAPMRAESFASLPRTETGIVAKERPLIVLDPGHGGRDPGAEGQSGTLEDRVNLNYAVALKGILERRGYDVLLTRTDDVYVSHEDRIGLARDRHADLFMSIHADSHADHGLRGASVYTLSERRSQRLEDEIRREGKFVLYDVEVSRDDGVGDILLDLAQSATLQNSDRLATSLVDNMRGTMPLLKNPKRRGALLVLLSPDVPAVLVELGFLSNAKDEQNLRSRAWQQAAVTAIADGIDEYFDGGPIETRLAGGLGSSGQ